MQPGSSAHSKFKSDDRALLCHGPARPGNNNTADSGEEDSFDSSIISNSGKRLQGSNGGLQLKDSSLRVTMSASGLPALIRQQGRHQHSSQRLEIALWLYWSAGIHAQRYTSSERFLRAACVPLPAHIPMPQDPPKGPTVQGAALRQEASCCQSEKPFGHYH